MKIIVRATVEVEVDLPAGSKYELDQPLKDMFEGAATNIGSVKYTCTKLVNFMHVD